MSPRITTSAGRKIETHWNELNVLERLKLILEYRDFFLGLHLVTPSEIDLVEHMSPTEWEYIVQREEHPIFANIDLCGIMDIFRCFSCLKVLRPA
ncbi:hypothetical protein COY07_02880 [Candidatus Peregrinibacteria bacterium CG_4_10_14_0_2_um_filter_43_11]|nr:MAG: hypothetical protein COY07_02880 [Candidatus Peregrinibacteria bacterium CG_4_10_14_0_2_um_filter_43_11]